VIEPIQGEGGFIVPAPGFLTGLAAWARAHGIVFVADEVQTGFARTGAMFASEHEGLVPDLIVTAKGIADGLPLAAVTGRAEIMDGPHTGGLGGTYGGNPVACAAALATLRTIREDGLVTRAGAIGEAIRQRAAGGAGGRPTSRRRPWPRRHDCRRDRPPARHRAGPGHHQGDRHGRARRRAHRAHLR
jgi:4-aminobutyrate aminotransferase/(S)-3-amino-2-methylpropionate transaminase